MKTYQHTVKNGEQQIEEVLDDFASIMNGDKLINRCPIPKDLKESLTARYTWLGSPFEGTISESEIEIGWQLKMLYGKMEWVDILTDDNPEKARESGFKVRHVARPKAKQSPSNNKDMKIKTPLEIIREVGDKHESSWDGWYYSEDSVVAAMEEYASQFQSDTGKEPTEPTEETPFYCTCGVPNFLHATACGWHNAALVIDPKTEQEKEWYRKAQEANPIWFTVEPPKAEAGEPSPSPEITGQEGKAKTREEIIDRICPSGNWTDEKVDLAMQEYAQQPDPIKERAWTNEQVLKAQQAILNNHRDAVQEPRFILDYLESMQAYEKGETTNE